MPKRIYQLGIALLALIAGYIVFVAGFAALVSVVDALLGTGFGQTTGALAVAGVIGLAGAYVTARKASSRV